MEYANAVIRINYVTLLLSGTLIKHGVNEVLTDKKEGANSQVVEMEIQKANS
jgi:hypothetical protein